jgi:hypothetical protein
MQRVFHCVVCAEPARLRSDYEGEDHPRGSRDARDGHDTHRDGRSGQSGGHRAEVRHPRMASLERHRGEAGPASRPRDCENQPRCAQVQPNPQRFVRVSSPFSQHLVRACFGSLTLLAHKVGLRDGREITFIVILSLGLFLVVAGLGEPPSHVSCSSFVWVVFR